MKPPFAYYGGKTMVADRIAALLPEHQHYVEPFAGSLAVLLAKPRIPFETVNDLDGRLIAFWRVLRDYPEDLMRVCSLTPHSRLEYEQAFQLDGDLDELERARRVWVLLTQGRSAALKKTGWRCYKDGASSSGASMPRYVRGYVERLGPAAERLLGCQIECRDAVDVIRDYGGHATTLIYADPPYLGTTRSGRQYSVEMSLDAQHKALCEALRSCAAAVVLSGYDSPLYEDLYGDWHRVEIPTTTGNGAAGVTARTEVLWSNRPLRVPATLFEETA